MSNALVVRRVCSCVRNNNDLYSLTNFSVHILYTAPTTDTHTLYRNIGRYRVYPSSSSDRSPLLQHVPNEH